VGDSGDEAFASAFARFFASAPGGHPRLLGRLSASRLGTVTAIEAIVRQDDRHPSIGATEGGRPLLLPDA
jgi:hypothetical protein